MIESGALWNQDVTKIMREIGFKQSTFDPCVFLKTGLWIVLYVYDLYITYDANEPTFKELQDGLVEKFGGAFKFPVDDTIEVLGMKFLVRDGGVYITMPDEL